MNIIDHTMDELIKLREKVLELERKYSLYNETENSGKIGGWEFDPVTLKQNWTDQIFRILEINLEHGAPEVPKGLAFIDPKFRPMAEQAIQQAMEHGEPYNQEWIVTTHRGNKKWVNAVCNPKIADGKVVAISGSFQDITTKKIVEEELKQSEEKLRLVLNNNPFPVAVVDETDNNIMFWSKSAIQLFGHDPKTTEEWYELAYPNPEYRQEVIERWKPFLEIAQNSTKAINTGEYEIHCKNGTVKICELYAQFIPGRLIVTLNDITQRKNAESQLYAQNQQLVANEQQLRAANQQLQASEQQLRAANQQLQASEQQLRAANQQLLANEKQLKAANQQILKAKEKAEESEGKLKAALASMTEAIFISDLEGNFIDFNLAFASFHKFKSKEECAKTLKEYPEFLDVFYLDGELLPMEMWVVLRALRGDTGINEEYVLKRKDTDETWIGSYNYSPIRNNEGNIIGSVVTAHDITERKKTHDELKKHRDHLDELVKERTAELEEKNKMLDDHMRVFVGRELRIKKLEKDIRMMGGEKE